MSGLILLLPPHHWNKTRDHGKDVPDSVDDKRKSSKFEGVHGFGRGISMESGKLQNFVVLNSGSNKYLADTVILRT